MADNGFISLAHSFQHDVFGQPRTSKYKQYVILKGQWVYKGPYNPDRLARLLERCRWLKYWQTAHAVLPMESIDTIDGKFIKFPNLITTQLVESTDHKESFTGRQYRIVKRVGLLKLNQCLLQEKWIYNRCGQSLLLALIQLWLLGTGDMGLCNILACLLTRRVYLVDFDESRSKEREDAEFYFSKPAGKKYQWHDNMQRFYPSVVSKLQRMLSDKTNQPFTERINRAIILLRKFSPPPAISSSITTSSSTISEAAYSPKFRLINIGRMKWGGPFNGTTTFSGHSLDIVKSALQKYIRRGITDKALYAAFELWRLAQVGGVDGQTNMYNRLAIICAEDIGPADLDLAVYVINYVITEVKSRKDRSPPKLAAIVQLMAQCMKTRVMSHIWRTFATDVGRSLAIKRGRVIDVGRTPPGVISCRNSTVVKRFFRADDPDVIIPPAYLFYHHLLNRDYNAVYWLAEYLKVSDGLKVKARRRRTKPIIIIWQMLADFLAPSLVETLSKAYFTLSEGRPFLMTVVTAALYRTGKKWVTKDASSDVVQLVDVWKNHSSLVELLSGKYDFTIDDYVIDKHTREGGRRGKTHADFVREGALINNEHPRYKDAQLAEIYMES